MTRKEEAFAFVIELLTVGRNNPALKNEHTAYEKALDILSTALAEQPKPVGVVKDLFTMVAWEKLDVVGSTPVYLGASPSLEKLTVKMITTAYEQGVGTGQQAYQTNWKTVPKGTPVLFRRSQDSEYEEGTYVVGDAYYGVGVGAFYWGVHCSSGNLYSSVGACITETGEWHVDPHYLKLAHEPESAPSQI